MRIADEGNFNLSSHDDEQPLFYPREGPLIVACCRTSGLMQLWVSAAPSSSPEELEQLRCTVLDLKADAVVAESRFHVEGSDARILLKASDGRSLVSDGLVACGLASNQFQAMSVLGSVEWLLLESDQDRRTSMIGLENVISAARKVGTKVAAAVGCAEEVQGAAFALDVGVDAIVLLANADDALREAAVIARSQRLERSDPYVERTQVRPTAISVGYVTRVEPGIVGDRVAIDFTRLLRQGEGALVGSSASALALVHGETLPSDLVAQRPFRVNAGPVHAYCLLADGRTKYLCELVPGDSVLVVDANAQTARAVAVGRLKIETRPHLLISFSSSAKQSEQAVDCGQLFLQQAETVRLLVADRSNIKPHWIAKSVTRLLPGDAIAVSFARYGTHCGYAVPALVVEK